MQTSDAATKRDFCFECDCRLIGPLCPSCNLITDEATRNREIRWAGLFGIAFGIPVGAFALFLFNLF